MQAYSVLLIMQWVPVWPPWAKHLCPELPDATLPISEMRRPSPSGSWSPVHGAPSQAHRQAFLKGPSLTRAVAQASAPPECGEEPGS